MELQNDEQEKSKKTISNFQMVFVTNVFVFLLLISGFNITYSNEENVKIKFKLPDESGIYLTQISHSLISVFILFRRPVKTKDV